MTLLSRGITSSQQGLSYLDRAIAKAEADDQEFKSNVNLYNDTLEGFKSSSTYLGNRSRNILNEYSKAFEGAIDMYAADPSEENQQRIDNIKLQTLDFYNRAVAARQNSLTQLNSFRANPANYNISLEEALQQFSDAEDANVFARFDMNSMEMLVGEGESQQTVGNVGYYNGVDPMFFEKAPSIGTIEAEGTYGANNLERYYSLIGTDEGKEKIIEAFMETARPSTSTYQETAIYNYIQDVKGVDLSKIKSEVELRDRILEVRNDPAELSAALRHMGELEYDWMLGAKNAKQLQASQDKFNALFRGDFETRTDAKRAEVTMTPQDGELGDYVDNLYGVERVRRLKNARGTGTAAGDIAGLSEYGDNLLGYEVDAIGNIIVLVDKTIPDPEDEEKTKKELNTYVLTGDNPDERMNDLYDNLYRELKADGIFDMLKNQSYQRQLEIERKAKIAREQAAWANTPEHTAPDEFITTTVEDVRLATGPSLDKRREQTKEQQIEDIQSQFNFTGNNAILVSPRRGRRGMDVAALNRSFVDRLVEEGYNPQEIKQGIEYMQKEGITVGVSPLRNFLQTLGLPTRYGRADLGIGGDDMSKAVSAFQDALVELNPEKYLTGPKPMTESDEYRQISKELFGRDFTEDLSENPQASEIAVRNSRDKDQKEKYLGTLIELGEKYGVPFPEVMASQSVLESAWGKSEAAPNNVFGITWSDSLMNDLRDAGIKAYRGDAVPTKEYEEGRMKDKVRSFMGFESLDDAVRAYKYLIDTRQVYEGARNANTALEYLEGLQFNVDEETGNRSGYATDPDYINKITSIASDSLGIDLSQRVR